MSIRQSANWLSLRCRSDERARPTLLERAPVLEAGEAVGRRLLLGDAVAHGRSAGRASARRAGALSSITSGGRQPPEDDGLHRDEDHDREDRAREPEVVQEDGERRAVSRATGPMAMQTSSTFARTKSAPPSTTHERQAPVVVAARRPEDQQQRQRRRAPRRSRRSRVERDLQRARRAHRRHRQADRDGADEHRPLPAEEQLARDDEDERQRDEPLPPGSIGTGRHSASVVNTKNMHTPKITCDEGCERAAGTTAAATTGTPTTTTARTYRRSRSGNACSNPSSLASSPVDRRTDHALVPAGAGAARDRERRERSHRNGNPHQPCIPTKHPPHLL